jgi:hypothetical protein
MAGSNCLYSIWNLLLGKLMRKSKTMWFALLLVILGFVADNFSYVQSVIDPKYYGISYIAIGAIVAVLRFVTTKPLEDK